LTLRGLSARLRAYRRKAPQGRAGGRIYGHTNLAGAGAVMRQFGQTFYYWWFFAFERLPG